MPSHPYDAYHVRKARRKYKGPVSYKLWAKNHVRQLKNKCKFKDMPFDMSVDDLTLHEVCPILGIPLVLGGDRNHSPSIDRIDPKGGYVSGNVRIISFLANRWKNDMSLDEAKLLVLNWNAK